MGSSPYSPVIPLVICLPLRPLTRTLMAPGCSEASWFADRPACPPLESTLQPLISVNSKSEFLKKKKKQRSQKPLTVILI